MKVRCAWHKPEPIIFGEKPPYDDDSVTDVICPECYELLMGRKKENKPQFCSLCAGSGLIENGKETISCPLCKGERENGGGRRANAVALHKSA